MSSAVGALETALVARLNADAQFVAAIGGAQKIFQLKPPATGASLPYIIMGAATEQPFDTLDKKGNNGTVLMSIYSSQTTNKAQVTNIYAHVHRVLNFTRLTVAGHVHVLGRVTLLSAGLDSDGNASVAVAQYRGVTQ